MRRRTRSWALFLCTLAVAACGLLPDGPVVRLDNVSNSPAVVDVNGTWVGTFAGGTSADVFLATHGVAPFMVTVRTPNGNIAAQLVLTAADVEAGAEASGNMWAQGELPCGVIRLSYGQPSERLPAVALAELPPCSP